MSANFYLFLHVSSVLLLAGGTFYAFAAPAESRKRMLMLTGIASLLALVGGFGVLQKTYNGEFYFWVIVKIVAWVGLSMLAGLAIRHRQQKLLWVLLASFFSVLAVAMAVFKPGL